MSASHLIQCCVFYTFIKLWFFFIFEHVLVHVTNWIAPAVISLYCRGWIFFSSLWTQHDDHMRKDLRNFKFSDGIWQQSNLLAVEKFQLKSNLSELTPNFMHLVRLCDRKRKCETNKYFASVIAFCERWARYGEKEKVKEKRIDQRYRS